MNIAVFIKSTTFHKGYGGFEIQNRLLCEGLVSRGHKVTVYSPRKELSLETKEENGVLYKFIECKFGNFKTLYSGSKSSWEKRSVEVFLADHNKYKYDIVLGQSSWALPIIRIKKELGIKVISILHGSKIGEYQTQLKNVKSLKELAICIRDLPHVLKTFFGSQREFVQNSDKLIAVSSFVKISIIDETYVSEDKVEVINNGINPILCENVIKKDVVMDGQVQLIYVGRIIRAKGLFVLMNSIKKLTGNNWKLIIVGDGDALELLKAQVTDKKLTDKVEFLGHMKYEDVLAELGKSDIFVLPSLRMEGFPMTIVEAMFFGLPVVVSDIGGNSDAVVDGETGYLVDPGKSEDLANKLQELIDDPKKRKSFGIEGRNKAYKEFTIDKMIDGYEQVIKEVKK